MALHLASKYINNSLDVLKKLERIKKNKDDNWKKKTINFSHNIWHPGKMNTQAIS